MYHKGIVGAMMGFMYRLPRYFNQALLQVYIYYTAPSIFQLFLKKLSLANRAIRLLWAPPSPGRRPLDQETIDLILQMKKLNPKWGGQKISDELKKIGYRACKVTVLKYLEIYGLHDPPIDKISSWKEFLGNHKFKISIDFTSIISLMGHQLFIFVMINLDTRKLVSINATYSPNLEWLKQQFRDALQNKLVMQVRHEAHLHLSLFDNLKADQVQIMKTIGNACIYSIQNIQIQL